MKKVIIITGGSSGIGKSIGDFLSDKGYLVFGTSRNPDRISNSKFLLLPMEVTNSQSIQQVFATVLEKAGRIDVVINNAGVGITGPIEETPLSEIKKAFDVNLFGPIEVMQSVLPHLRKQKSGLIINVTSIAGYMGLPYRGIYSATKSALEIATEAVRMEVKKFGINIVNVAPGDFATNIAAGRYHAPVLENSEYEIPYRATLKMMDDHIDSGSNPNEMANAVYRIIKTKNPKTHYKVGAWIQKFSIVLKRILPDVLYEKLLMNHYRL